MYVIGPIDFVCFIRISNSAGFFADKI